MGGRLKDKVCVITGGATGMGGVASNLFAAEGAKVVIGDLKEEEGGQTPSIVRGSHVSSLRIKCNTDSR